MKSTEKVIAVIAAEGFEQAELLEPLNALKRNGVKYHVISIKKGTIRGWEKDHWTEAVKVDKDFSEAVSEDYDGLLIPGGVINCDKLRTEDSAVNFVSDFFEQGKPVAAICHGPQMLIEADVLDGRKVTSYKAIKTDVENAGAQWYDQEVVVDKGLVTSRGPSDLPAFISKMLEEFHEGRHAQQHA